MKSTNRLLAMLMVLVMIIGTMPVFAFAAQTDAFSDFPAGSWSEEAMTAAINNGLLIGKGDGTIAPKDYLTRAEVATIINRAFGATVKADISRYTDVSADDWYYTEFQKAVNMQTVVGVDESRLNPTGYISRECVFTIMARALVLSAGDTSALSKFSDASSVSSWAAPFVSAMIANGYVNGNGNGNINPKSYITREEFAQILHNTIKTYITKDGEVSGTFEGNLLVRVPGVKLSNVTVNGDLIVADGVGKGDLDLNGVRVTGRILFRGGEGKVTFDKTCSVGKFIIVHDVNGVVNFNNYRTEAIFDNIVLDTDATFLQKKPAGTTVRPSRPSGPSGTTTTYTVKFDGVEYEVEEGKKLSEAVSTLDPSKNLGEALEAAKTKKGYTFDFFHVAGDESKKITGAETADSDIEIVGKWTIITYTVKYNLGKADGKISSVADGKYTVLTGLALATPDTWNGYNFLGWYNEDALTTRVTEIAIGDIGDRTLYAKWEAITYTITYDLGEGDGKATFNPTENDKKYNIETELVLPEPTWAGHTFLGWYTDNTFSQQISKIEQGTTGNKTFVAKWEEIAIPTNSLLGFEFEEVGNEIKVYITLNKIPYDADNLTDITLRYKQTPASGMTFKGAVSLIGGDIQATDGNIAWMSTTPVTKLPAGGRIFEVTYENTASFVGDIVFSYAFTQIYSKDGEASKYDTKSATLTLSEDEKDTYRVNLYSGADTPLKGYYDIEANGYITQAQIDAVLGEPSTYKGARGYEYSNPIDEENKYHLLYPELWYKADGEWKIFEPDKVAITKDTDVYLLRRYISLKYTTDLSVKGIDIPDFVVTVPYDSDTYIGETVLDGLAAVRSTISRMLNILEIQGVDAYQIALDKLAGLKLIDADGNILNVEVKVPLHKLINEQMITSTIDKYVDNNLNNEDFIVSILKNDAVVNMLLEDEGIKISVLEDETKLNTFLTDAKIKEMMGKQNIVDIILKDEGFKASFINSDATFEYIIGDLKNLLDTDEYHDMIIDACVEYVIDVYFEETKESLALENYIDDTLIDKKDEIIADLEEILDDNKELKGKFKKDIKDGIEEIANSTVPNEKKELYDEIRTSQTFKEAIIKAVKSDDVIMNKLKDDIKTDLKKADSSYKDTVITAVRDELNKAGSTLKSDIVATLEAELSDVDSSIRKSVLDDIKNETGDISDKVKTYVKDNYKDDIETNAKDTVKDSAKNWVLDNIASVKDDIKNAVKGSKNALVTAILDTGYAANDSDAADIANEYLNGSDQTVKDEVNAKIDEYFATESNITSLINNHYDEMYDSLYADIFDEIYDVSDIFDEAYSKYINDGTNLTTAFDTYISDPNNLEMAVDLCIKDDDTLISAINTYIADADKLNKVFDIYTADVENAAGEKEINPNMMNLFNEYIKTDANLDAAVKELVSHETEFDAFYDNNLGVNAPNNDLFNMLFENYFESHVHVVAKSAYNSDEKLKAIVMDYVHDYTDELVVEYAEGRLETEHAELVAEIDNLMHNEFPAEIRAQYFAPGSKIKVTVDKIIEKEGATVINKYVAGTLDATTADFIKTESRKQIEAIIDKYVAGTLDDAKKELIDNEINAYINELIDDYISGADRATLGSLIPTYAKDAVDALKETPEFKNTISDFTSGKGVRVNEGNVMFVSILADLLADYNYDKIKAELLPERIVKIADIVGDDVIVKYVDALFDDFVGGMKSAVDKVNADIDANIKGTEYTFSTTPSVLVKYMEDFVVNYYNKLYSKARAKVYAKADVIRLEENTYAKQLVDFNWLSLFFNDGAAADTMKSGYKLKDEIIDYYDGALKQIVLLHDAITWYGTRDDMTTEQKLDAASVLIANYANKANNIIMNYIDNGELPKGYTKDEVIAKIEALYEKLAGKISQLDKIEELYESKEETINSYIDKAINLYREYGDRDYNDIIDLANMSIYADGKTYLIYKIILESNDEVFDFDDLCTAVFESANYHGVSKIESAMAKIKSKMDQYSYTPTVNDTARYVRNAYKASVGPKTIKGKTTGTHTAELQRYLSYIIK